MRIELQKLHKEINATMIYVTHDQTEAMTLGNRIAVLKKGKLMQLDTPLQLYNHPSNEFVAGFIGSPAMNFISGNIIHEGHYFFIDDHGECRIDLGLLSKSADNYINKKIRIGVRPEDIVLDEAGRHDAVLKVMAYENMGNEQLIYLTLAPNTIIGRRPFGNQITIGQEIGVKFRVPKIIFFDIESGGVIHLN